MSTIFLLSIRSRHIYLVYAVFIRIGRCHTTLGLYMFIFFLLWQAHWRSRGKLYKAGLCCAFMGKCETIWLYGNSCESYVNAMPIVDFILCGVYDGTPFYGICFGCIRANVFFVRCILPRKSFERMRRCSSGTFIRFFFLLLDLYEYYVRAGCVRVRFFAQYMHI